MESKVPSIEVNAPDANGDVPAEIPVLIVGGGPVGLTMSLLLSQQGIRSLLVEQHPGTAIFPKARFLQARAMEIFRQMGIEDAIRNVAIPHTRNVIWAPSLAGEEIVRRPIKMLLPETVREWSPTWGCTSSQELIEPVLLAAARRLAPAQIRFSTQLTSFEQHEDHVVATLVHRPSGRVRQVRAQYIVGADGSHSPVREALGIRMLGEATLEHRVNILFRADLSPWMADREINFCFVTNPEATGMLFFNGEDRWRFTILYYPERGQRPEDFTPEHCLQLVRTAVGVPDVPVELGQISPWTDASLVAERFFDRRVFLAGDATHQMSPQGGFALNVGFADAHNLAWKLAAVLKGWAHPALLASYEAERAPVSRLVTEYSASNLGAYASSAGGAGRNTAPAPSPTPKPRVLPERLPEHGLVFGTSYDSAVIVPDGTPPVEVANPITDYLPNARPGSRAPHLWLRQNGTQISTLDLFGSGFVILSGPSGRAWGTAAKEAFEKEGIPSSFKTIGASGDLAPVDESWQAVYDVEDDGAVLVRPDGFVAWRSRMGANNDRSELIRALRIATGSSV